MIPPSGSIVLEHFGIHYDRRMKHHRTLASMMETVRYYGIGGNGIIGSIRRDRIVPYLSNNSNQNDNSGGIGNNNGDGRGEESPSTMHPAEADVHIVRDETMQNVSYLPPKSDNKYNEEHVCIDGKTWDKYHEHRKATLRLC